MLFAALFDCAQTVLLPPAAHCTRTAFGVPCQATRPATLLLPKSARGSRGFSRTSDGHNHRQGATFARA